MNVPVALFDAVLTRDGNLKPEWQQFLFREVKLNNLKFLCFNMQASPWGKQAEMRHRVAAAIDRDDIVRQLFRGKARIATSVIPSGVAGFGSSAAHSMP